MPYRQNSCTKAQLSAGKPIALSAFLTFLLRFRFIIIICTLCAHKGKKKKELRAEQCGAHSKY